ncbi:MAG: hypothetical protein AYP45_09920 [Candidatus Brocadia carolinensis]|uniref:Uncharacterized protein n=1 Tax=Candidatus Brocadia carolinensis TaxID=1004156 RepID=A0A1V4ATF1_9BACT|nr:MAG: hypothetical protein AYP45_09920 [Candidatus Brocadia caroliniensis]
MTTFFCRSLQKSGHAKRETIFNIHHFHISMNIFRHENIRGLIKPILMFSAKIFLMNKESTHLARTLAATKFEIRISKYETVSE